MWSREECTERITAIEEFFEITFAATIYIKKYGRRRLERCWCAKESPKTLLIDTLWPWKRNYHRTFVSKAVVGVFAVLWQGDTQSQVWASSTSTRNGMHYNSHRNVLIIHCRKICCRKYFVRLIFVALYNYKNFSTPKISRFMVWVKLQFQ